MYHRYVWLCRRQSGFMFSPFFSYLLCIKCIDMKFPILTSLKATISIYYYAFSCEFIWSDYNVSQQSIKWSIKKYMWKQLKWGILLQCISYFESLRWYSAPTLITVCKQTLNICCVSVKKRLDDSGCLFLNRFCQ